MLLLTAYQFKYVLEERFINTFNARLVYCIPIDKQYRNGSYVISYYSFSYTRYEKLLGLKLMNLKNTQCLSLIIFKLYSSNNSINNLFFLNFIATDLLKLHL